MKACREGDSNPSTRKVVDQRPFLSDPNWTLKRGNHATGADLNSFRDRRKGCAQHCRIRVESTETMKVALRRPDRREATIVRELCRVNHEPIFVIRETLTRPRKKRRDLTLPGTGRRWMLPVPGRRVPRTSFLCEQSSGFINAESFDFGEQIFDARYFAALGLSKRDRLRHGDDGGSSQKLADRNVYLEQVSHT